MNENEIPADQFVVEIISGSVWHMDMLRAVRDLNLPDCMIGAGFVRNAVWDRLHGSQTFTPFADIDVVYFDPARSDRERDAALERQLENSIPGEHWSVRNQARMHQRNGDAPYSSSEDAIAHWLETPTCIAVQVGEGDLISIVAPHGVDDLIGLIVRPTPSGIIKPDQYHLRIEEKNWASHWPRLNIKMPE